MDLPQKQKPLYEIINNQVLSQFQRCVSLPFDAFDSGAYLYPFIGINYFFTHSELWPFYLTIFVPQLFLTFVIYVTVFVVCFPIQALIMMLIAGPFAVITTWLSVVQQSVVISSFLVTFLMLPEIQRITFDAVLSREFANDAILLGKLRRIVKVPFWVKCGNIVMMIPDILSFPFVLGRAILLLLIGMIPFIGPCLVILIQAPSKGLQSHARYFVLKGYTKEQIKSYYIQNTGAYVVFGIVSLVLELIPLFNVFVMFTNNLGAALWAVDIENRLKAGIEIVQMDDELLPIERVSNVEKFQQSESASKNDTTPLVGATESKEAKKEV